jgi:NADPH2:quinone reductase
MKAVIAKPSAKGWVEIGEVPAPTCDSHEALVRVTAFSVNRGEVNRARTGTAGTQVGWDVAGVVEQAARDGSGPKAGTRVVGMSLRQQGWAEFVALPTFAIAPIPDAVSDAQASTLPVAGLTALYGLERCERLAGERVLVTGATGGVGYFACQLATIMGAEPVALLRRPDHKALIEATGARVIVSEDGSALADEPKFRSIIDGVGGPLFGHLVNALDAGGRLISYGISGGLETSIQVRQLLLTGDGRVEGFHLYRESEKESASKGLTRLQRLMVQGRLDGGVTLEKDWGQIAAVTEAIIERTYFGKAVLTV